MQYDIRIQIYDYFLSNVLTVLLLFSSPHPPNFFPNHIKFLSTLNPKP